MFETIVIGALVVLIIAAGIFSWWLENGGSPKDEDGQN